MSNVDALELIWTAISLIGLIAAARGVKDALRDRRILRESSTNSGLMLIASGDLRREALRMYVQGFFLLLGVIALLSPPSSAPRTTVGSILAVGFVAAAFCITVSTVLDRRLRSQLEEQLRK